VLLGVGLKAVLGPPRPHPPPEPELEPRF
jgi:hypothetical protein